MAVQTFGTQLSEILLHGVEELTHLSLPFSALLEFGVSAKIQLPKLKSLVIGGNDTGLSRIPLQDIQVIANIAPNLIFLDLSSCDYRLCSDNSSKLVSLCKIYYI